MGASEQAKVPELIGQVRERLTAELRTQAEDLRRLEQSLKELAARYQQMREAFEHQFETLARSQGGASSSQASLDKLLSAVRNLITATLPQQVFDVLTEEAEQLGVRSALFDVRGKAAWGASARGFGSQLSLQAFRTLAVPLNQDNPFRQAFEMGGHVDATAESLKKNRNVLEKLKPASDDPVLILPIRSAGSVSAIFYSDPGGKGRSLPVEALKILAEFAGAQLDRLMALSGGMPGEAAATARKEEPEVRETEEVSEAGGSHEEVAAPAQAGGPSVFAREPAAIDMSQLSEADRKTHQDAKRFAKLLISEIDLYNKNKVAEGRKTRSLYQLLKADIERSRNTYEKRFGKTIAKQVDYFHEELIRTLAANDPSLLGTDYPGPSV